MTLQSHLHTFQITTTDAVNTTYDSPTLAFEPKFLFLTTTGRANATDSVGNRTVLRSVGFAASTSSRFGVGSIAVDNVATSDTAHSSTNARCLTIPNASAANAYYLLDVNSITSTAYQMILDANNSAPLSVRTSILAIGGSDVLEVDLGTLTEKATTGSQTITLATMTGTPNLIIFISAGLTSATVSAHGRMMLGATDGTRQGVWLGYSQDAITNSNTLGYHITSECLAMCNTSGTLDARATITSVGAGQFVINWGEVDGAGTRLYYYAALRLTNARVDNVVTDTSSPGTFGDSGWGFKPGAMIFFSGCKAESTADTPTDNDVFSCGLIVDETSRIAQGSSDADNSTRRTSIIEYDEAYAHAEGGSTLGLGDVTSMDAGGWTGAMDDADSVAALVTTIAFGPGAAAATGHGPLIGGRLVRGTLRNQLAWSA